MVKTHNETGLKYLCMTRKKDYINYSGSGKIWVPHLEKHGYNYSTELLFETKDKEEFRRVALEYSNNFNVVESTCWANLRDEQGDGGDTVSNKMWITNEVEEKYILKTNLIPFGWRRGRNSKCAFRNKDIQKDLNKRTDRIKAGKGIKEAWNSGRFDKRDLKGKLTKGKNPQAKPVRINEIEFDSIQSAIEHFNTNRYQISKAIRENGRYSKN